MISQINRLLEIILKCTIICVVPDLNRIYSTNQYIEFTFECSLELQSILSELNNSFEIITENNEPSYIPTVTNKTYYIPPNQIKGIIKIPITDESKSILNILVIGEI